MDFGDLQWHFLEYSTKKECRWTNILLWLESYKKFKKWNGGNSTADEQWFPQNALQWCLVKNRLVANQLQANGCCSPRFRI
jgi:hypothetical protein